MTTITESTYSAALSYAELGFTVIPVDYGTKKPSVEWKQFQERKPTEEELKAWFDNGEPVNVGVVVSGDFVCIDFDNEESFLKLFSEDERKRLLEDTLVTRTRRGYHVWFRSKEPCGSFKVAELGIEVFSAASGRFVMMPPSLHPDGSQYRFMSELRRPEEIEVGLEKSLRDRCAKLGVKPPLTHTPLTGMMKSSDPIFVPVVAKITVKPWRRLGPEMRRYFRPVSQGKREERAFKLATLMLNELKLPQSTAKEWLTIWNYENKPPLDATEIDHALESAGTGGYVHSKETLQPIDPSAELFSVDLHGNPHFEPVVFANRLLTQYPFKVMEDNFDIFVYTPEKGIWEPKGSQIIHAEMGKLLQEENRKRYVQDVEHAIICTPGLMVPRPTPLLNKIAVQNGILNLTTGQLEAGNPDDFIVTQIPVKFDPAATCPTIDKFLNEVTHPEMNGLVEESIAYCLWQARPIHKATLIIGPPESGKSTFLKVLRTFLGVENVSTIPLQTLCDQRFASAELYLKLANISADLPKQAIRYLGIFKMAVGGDPITGEHKHGRFFTFLPYAKHFYSCNSIPETKEDSSAYYRRWNIIEFPTAFTDRRDANLDQKLQTPQELSGLLNKCIRVLPRLLERKAFSIDEETDQIRANYILKSNSTHAFIEAKLEQSLSDTDEIDKQLLYREYIQFCTEHEAEILGVGELTRGMKQKMPGPSLMLKRGDTTTRVWRYVKWKL